MQRYLTIVTKWNFYNSNKVKCIQNRWAMKLKFYGSIIIQMSKISWLFINDSKSDVNIFFSRCGFHQTFFYHDRLIDWFASIVYRINIFYFPNSMIDLASESLCSASKMTAILILTMALSKIMYRVGICIYVYAYIWYQSQLLIFSIIRVYFYQILKSRILSIENYLFIIKGSINYVKNISASQEKDPYFILIL